MLATVGAERARFCHGGCSSAFRADRRAGLIYLSARAPEGTYTHEQCSLIDGTCAYCRAIVTRRPRIKVAPRWPRQAPP